MLVEFVYGDIIRLFRSTPASSSYSRAYTRRTARKEPSPSTSPFYGPHLDRDKDGFGCDAGGADEVDDVSPEVGNGVTGDWGQQDWEQGNWDQQWPAADQQVAQMPVGGADTGVAQESSNGAGALALGGGLALIAAAGAVFGIRRARA